VRAIFILALAAACAHAPAPAPELAHPIAIEEPPDTDSIGITWIGHATVLVRLDDRWFLTDPVLGDSIAGGFRERDIAPGIRPQDLPHLDAILISHSHFDHLDVPSLRALAGPPILVPTGSARYLPRELPRVALDTWQSWTRDGVTITAVPSSHGGGRYWIDDLWIVHGHTGYVIQYKDLTVYFAGDTGFDAAQSAAIAKRFHIDVALIPVGPAGRPHWLEHLRKKVHVTPEDALRLFSAVGAQWMVPIHFGTFFSPMSHERPYVERAIAASPLRDRVRVLGIGETTTFFY